MAEAASGVGKERVHRPAKGVDLPHQLVDALLGGEVGLQGFDLGAGLAKALGGLDDGRLVGDDQQVEAVLAAFPGELIADARGGAGDDGEGTKVWHFAVSWFGFSAASAGFRRRGGVAFLCARPGVGHGRLRELDADATALRRTRFLC